MRKRLKNTNYLTQKEFLKLYEKRLEKVIGRKKKYAVKVLKFIIKNISFNVLVGNVVKIQKLGTFYIKETKNTKRYNFWTKKVDNIESEERFAFQPSRGLVEDVRDSSIEY